MEQFYDVIQTEMGFAGIVATARGLRRVYLPARTRAAIERTIRAAAPGIEEDRELLPELVDELQRYFAGQAVEFHVRCDWRGHSEFEEDVWHACRRIGYGKTSSYGALAEAVGRPGGARAIGVAMSRNPCPIVVPCHRVLKSDGSLGGYSGPGGAGFKQRLLDMEAAAVTA